MVNSNLSVEEVAVYDRQIRLWGIDAQNRMRKSKNLIINLGGLSAEVVKNMVLAGVGSVTLVDSKKVEEADLSANFFLEESDLNKNRAEAACPRIQKLNSRVEINLETSVTDAKELTEEWLSQFNTVLATGLKYEELCHINEITHKHKQSFFAADLNGLYGFVFADLVEHTFKIEREKPNIPTKIGPETKTRSIVSSVSKKDSGKHVEILTKLEKYRPLKEVVENAVSGSFGAQFKGRRLLKISPLLPIQLAYWTTPKEELNFDSFKAHVTQKAADLGLPTGIIQDSVIQSFLSSVHAELSPVASVLGGVLAQDILNVLSLKEQPIQNFFIFNGDSNEGPIYTL